MSAAHATITGDRQLIANLKNLGKKANSINRQAMNAAATPIVKAAKAECPVLHDHLKRALTKKVYNRGAIAIAIIGADAGYVASATTNEKISGIGTKEESKAVIESAKEDGGIIRPAKYDHLVEFGHLSPDGKQIAANPFLRNAWDNSIAQAKQIYETKAAAGIEKAAGV